MSSGSDDDDCLIVGVQPAPAVARDVTRPAAKRQATAINIDDVESPPPVAQRPCLPNAAEARAGHWDTSSRQLVQGQDGGSAATACTAAIAGAVGVDDFEVCMVGDSHERRVRLDCCNILVPEAIVQDRIHTAEALPSGESRAIALVSAVCHFMSAIVCPLSVVSEHNVQARSCWPELL
jgi:hypothetical protein